MEGASSSPPASAQGSRRTGSWQGLRWWTGSTCRGIYWQFHTRGNLTHYWVTTVIQNQSCTSMTFSLIYWRLWLLATRSHTEPAPLPRSGPNDESKSPWNPCSSLKHSLIELLYLVEFLPCTTKVRLSRGFDVKYCFLKPLQVAIFQLSVSSVHWLLYNAEFRK